MKKTITFLSRRAAMLLLVMMLTTATAWAQTTITPTTPSQDGDGYYLIGSAAELYGFAGLVNNGNETANAKLTADIVVNENVLDANGEANTGDFVQWTPIGNDSYSGTFDGQGHTISGLYVSGSSGYVGFIGEVSGSATIKNLGIVDSYFNSSGNFLGSIVGYVDRQSSVTLANVYSTSTVKGANWIGGLVSGDGRCSVTIINSYFAGKTSANWAYGTNHDDLVSGVYDMPTSGTLNIVNTFVVGTSLYGTTVTAEQMSDGTVAAALHYYQDALADGSMFGMSGGKTNFSGTIDGVSVPTANITLHTFTGDTKTYSSKYVVGNTTPLPVNVACEGYNKFAGWYNNANLVGNAVTSISSSETGDKEYWAKYKQSHTVTFELDGGLIEGGEIDHYIEGEVTPLPAFVFNGGASFEGWYTTSDCSGERYVAIPATATEDMTFYAKWGEAKTSFYLMQEGEPVPASLLYEGENIVWLDKTTEQGYKISNNEGKHWGSGDDITVPYAGGEYAFSDNSGSNFRVNQSGFYVFTLTDKGSENWFVSVLKLKSMLNCDVASIPTQVYTGSEIEPVVTVKDGEATLNPDEDYEVTYSNNIDAGTATATITGKGDYSGKTAATFTIVNPVTTSYVDASGTLHENVEAVPLDNTMTTLPAGWYVVNSNVTVNSRIDLTGDTNLILGDGYTLDVKGIYIPQNSTLTIYAQSDGVTAGKIVSNPTSGAAIGGKSGSDNGNIVIHGGNIEATGAVYCAGIGSNDDQTGGSITIYGGTVTAKGGSDGAAIGGGRNCSGGTITIYGGDITANGPTDTDTCENGAGIGGGDCGAGGTITIYGGTITTYSRDGAGIGGGDEGDGGTITINGGTITSNKVNQGQGARIGGGCDGAPGTITINGGTITTNGGTGAGIGGGKRNPANGTVTINGGVIDASGSYGIGAGEDGADIAVTLGWSNASDRIYASSYDSTVKIAAGKRLVYTDGNNVSHILGGDNMAILTTDEKTAIAGKTLTPAIVLADNADNTSAIATAATLCTGGKTLAVQLSGRTLYKDGYWNTLTLPFAVTDGDNTDDKTFSGTPLEGAIVKELDGSTSNLNSEGLLTLNFSDATSIEAGKPYIVKWQKAADYDEDPTAYDIVNPVFSNVPVDDTKRDVDFSGGTFMGNYKPLEITVTGDNPNRNDYVVLAVGTKGNMLGYVNTNRTLGAFHAYFYIPANGGTPGASSFVLNTDDESTQTGIGHTEITEITEKADAIYDLQGRRVENPKKGLYIVNGRKVVIK